MNLLNSDKYKPGYCVNSHCYYIESEKGDFYGKWNKHCMRIRLIQYSNEKIEDLLKILKEST